MGDETSRDVSGFPLQGPEAPCDNPAAFVATTARHPVAAADKNSTSAMPSEPQSANADTLIEIDHVTFGYDASRTILNDVSLRFARGKVTSILGGSGCGKTTLLRLIGGVHARQPGRGALRRRGRRHARQRTAVPPAPPHGHAVPVRRAVHRPDGVRQRRLPAARADRPEGVDDPRHRADEAQCRRPARRGRRCASPRSRAAWRGASRWRARSRSTPS